MNLPKKWEPQAQVFPHMLYSSCPSRRTLPLSYCSITTRNLLNLLVSSQDLSSQVGEVGIEPTTRDRKDLYSNHWAILPYTLPTHHHNHSNNQHHNTKHQAWYDPMPQSCRYKIVGINDLPSFDPDPIILPLQSTPSDFLFWKFLFTHDFEIIDKLSLHRPV